MMAAVTYSSKVLLRMTVHFPLLVGSSPADVLGIRLALELRIFLALVDGHTATAFTALGNTGQQMLASGVGAVAAVRLIGPLHAGEIDHFIEEWRPYGVTDDLSLVNALTDVPRVREHLTQGVSRPVVTPVRVQSPSIEVQGD